MSHFSCVSFCEPEISLLTNKPKFVMIKKKYSPICPHLTCYFDFLVHLCPLIVFFFALLSSCVALRCKPHTMFASQATLRTSFHLSTVSIIYIMGNKLRKDSRRRWEAKTHPAVRVCLQIPLMFYPGLCVLAGPLFGWYLWRLNSERGVCAGR